MGLDAGFDHTGDFDDEESARSFNGDETLAQHENGAFLKPFMKFVEADLAAFRVPEFSLKECMNAMNQHGHEQFAVKFAPQATVEAGI